MRNLSLFLVGFLLLMQSAYAFNGGWINAHATFYGGGDASGTMGMYAIKFLFLYFFVIINKITKNSRLHFYFISFCRWGLWVWKFIQPGLWN